MTLLRKSFQEMEAKGSGFLLPLTTDTFLKREGLQYAWQYAFGAGQLLPFVAGQLLPFIAGQLLPFIAGQLLPFIAGQLLPSDIWKFCGKGMTATAIRILVKKHPGQIFIVGG